MRDYYDCATSSKVGNLPLPYPTMPTNSRTLAFRRGGMGRVGGGGSYTCAMKEKRVILLLTYVPTGTTIMVKNHSSLLYLPRACLCAPFSPATFIATYLPTFVTHSKRLSSGYFLYTMRKAEKKYYCLYL